MLTINYGGKNYKYEDDDGWLEDGVDAPVPSTLQSTLESIATESGSNLFVSTGPSSEKLELSKKPSPKPSRAKKNKVKIFDN